MGKPRGANPRAPVGVVKGGAIIALVRSFRETMAVALAAIKALRLGRRLPFLRWSVLRMILSRKRLLTEWQVGDGREQAALDFVLEHAAAGDIDAAIAALDRFSYERRLLINVGDEKGAILDAAVERVRPRCVLELGAYVGYSALRMARHLPESGSIISVELNPSNAAIAQRMIAHAGASHCIRIIVGSLGDGGRTLATLESFHGLGPGVLDFVLSTTPSRTILLTSGESSIAVGCAPAPSWSPTTSGSPERLFTRPTWRPRKEGAGGRGNTAPTPNIKHSSPTSSSNPPCCSREIDSARSQITGPPRILKPIDRH